MSVEVLRAHATEILEMEASVKGDRRVRKADGQLPGQGEEPGEMAAEEDGVWEPGNGTDGE